MDGWSRFWTFIQAKSNSFNIFYGILQWAAQIETKEELILVPDHLTHQWLHRLGPFFGLEWTSTFVSQRTTQCLLPQAQKWLPSSQSSSAAGFRPGQRQFLSQWLKMCGGVHHQLNEVVINFTLTEVWPAAASSYWRTGLQQTRETKWTGQKLDWTPGVIILTTWENNGWSKYGV